VPPIISWQHVRWSHCTISPYKKTKSTVLCDTLASNGTEESVNIQACPVVWRSVVHHGRQWPATVHVVTKTIVLQESCVQCTHQLHKESALDLLTDNNIERHSNKFSEIWCRIRFWDFTECCSKLIFNTIWKTFSSKEISRLFNSHKFANIYQTLWQKHLQCLEFKTVIAITVLGQK